MEIVFRYRFKLVSAAMTLIVMALIRTDADPTLWQAGLVTLMFYEINLRIVRIAWHAITLEMESRSELHEKFGMQKWKAMDFRAMEGSGK